ncbi:hypothetical protein VTI74DRAFT_8066 [Chaetomium olivicolor]
MIHPNQPRRGPSRWHFDIDKHLNPVFPPSVLPQLPAPIAHFLGYRTHAPARPLGNLAMIFWAVVGVFSSLAIIGAVVLHVPAFQSRGVPTIVGSFGAAAVLDFYAIESPLAQPRNAILGQMVSALTGISICKLFALSPHFESVRWLGASLACACATAVMALTGTVHPPAGATALMAVLDEDVSELGWFLFLPLLLGCCLMLAVALLVNNIQRRFPYYWWSPNETGQYWRGEVETEPVADGGTLPPGATRRTSFEHKPGEESGSSSSGDLQIGGRLARMSSVMSGREGEIVIRRGRVKIPEGLSLRPEEILSLEMLSERL